MRIKPHYVEVGGEQVVVLSRRIMNDWPRKLTFGEPPLPEPNERGNYPLAALDIVMARKSSARARKLGLTQAELAPGGNSCRNAQSY